MKSLPVFLAILFLGISFSACNSTACDASENSAQFLEYAETTFDNIYAKYSVEGEDLLRENYPFSDEYQATYLDLNNHLPNQYAYLWPYSGTFSATGILFRITGNEKYLDIIENRILKGLEEYYDTERHPFGYASYLSRAPLSDRFYDDNIWIGIDFVDMYHATGKVSYLEKAEISWNFVYSGYDEKLGGGIYWVEQNRTTKHSCSNAPAIVFALKLYDDTHKEDYLDKAKALYTWTKEHLQDKEDLLYYDNIRLNGNIDKKKFAYNSGQMLEATCRLYNITQEEQYLTEARALAEACYQQFFHDFTDGNLTFRILNSKDVWFSAVMSRGFVELYRIDKNPKYMNSFYESLKYAWTHMRDENGLFGSDWEGKEQAEEKGLLTQAAMVEMYTRFSCLNIE